MSFIDQWRAQLDTSLTECAKLVPAVPDVDLKYELMVIGILWPIRRPVHDFELEAMQAVQELLGDQAKYILRLVQQWDDDPLAAARNLAAQAPRSGQLGVTLNSLIEQFGAFPIFARELASQAQATGAKAQSTKSSSQLPIQNPRVLISYISSDGSILADEVRRRLEAEGIPLWSDLAYLEGERDWWGQITQAIDQVEFLLLVMTPAALSDEMIRKQWRYARQKGVCIYPLFQTETLDFKVLPHWIRQVHFYNINFEWPKLISDLHGHCQSPRIPFMVEDLPHDFVGRPAQLEQLVAYLFDQKREEAIAAVVALSGPGGYGKSMLAKALGHDDDIRNVFDNGILWVTLGENPGDLSRYLIDLIEVLSGERPGFTGLDAAVVRFSELLASRDLLLIIDDVWNAAHLKPFLQGGPRCARLITTRDATTLPLGAKIVQVGPMQRNEAVTLLGSDLPYSQLDQMHRLARRLGDWPLLLKLTNGVLRDRLYTGQQSLLEAIHYVNSELDRKGLTAFDPEDPTGHRQTVGATLEISLQLLDQVELARYYELAIFPEDINIPLVTLEKLWGVTGGLDDFDTEELCDRLHTLSLLSHFDLTHRYIRLHRAIQSYLADRQAGPLAGLHEQLLTVHRPVAGGWANLPPGEPYLWTYLAYHLRKSGQTVELANTVKDLRYLAAKILARGASYAEHDLLIAEETSLDDPILRPLLQTISQTSHLLAYCKTPQEIINLLHSRLNHLPELATLLQQAEPELPKPLLTARHHLPDLPDSALIRTLRGHTAGVLDCAISGDGSIIASIAKDNTLRVWDTGRGTERCSFTRPEAELWCCDISANGKVIIAALNNGGLILYDTKTRSERLAWQAHQAGILSCAMSGDASTAVSASKDKTLKVWDVQSGRERLTLAGHQRTVTNCDISADGKTVVSASNDGTLKVWDAQTGAERFTFTVQLVDLGLKQLTFYDQRDISFGCAISGDGTAVAGISSKGTITVWDIVSGAQRFTATGDQAGVYDCVLNRDGSFIVCALNSGLLKMWDTRIGAELLVLADHHRAANSCALSDDRGLLVSASDDKTIKIWNMGRKMTSPVPADQRQAAYTCALSADGSSAVSAMADQTLKVWDVKTGVERLSLKGHTRKINDCAISAAGTVIVSASQDQTLIVWDAQTGSKRFVLNGHTWSVSGCAVSPDGETIVSASDDKTVKIWDGQTGQERFTLPGHTRTVNSCAMSADKQILVSASGDGTLKVWDANLGSKQFTLTGHTAWVSNCAISGDGRIIVSASFDKTVKIWDTQNQAERHSLSGHTATVTGCAISADGAIVVSASRDKTVKVWDARTGVCLATLFVDEPLLDCACSADATAIMAVSNSGVYFLRLEK